MTEKKYDVVSLGSCTLDNIYEVDDVMRLELIGSDGSDKKYVAIEYSSKLNVKSVKFYPGGSAANIACDLGNIGLKTAYIGGIGNDAAGKLCMEDMKRHHVDISGVKIFEEDSTASSVILITPWGRDRSILAYKGANNLFGPEHVPEDLLKNTKCFAWTSLTSDKGINSIQKCINLTKQNGGIIAAAPSISIIKNRKDDTINLIKQSDITSMNDEEIEALTGKKDPLIAIKTLFSWGLKIVNVTFGKEGQWICDGKKIVKTHPPKIFPADTTGAGDATMSGIIYGYLKNKSMEETARIAASLSAMEIEITGVRVGMPEAYSQLDKFMQTHEIVQDVINL
ncbi:MAG: carbohydrate kinase family protein [Promethearchaeota archaeon]